MSKNALLIIDPQKDFCENTGSLFVTGADLDMQRLSKFINDNVDDIDFIGMTMDSHHVIDISHPAFWQDKDSKFPNPFTIITSQDVDSGTWTPRFMPKEAIKYIKDLELQGEFPHCIWPEHCVIGTEGAAIVKPIMDAVTTWSRKRSMFYQVVTKGTYPLTEHFGAFRANVEIAGRPETQLNNNFIKTLETYQNVYFAGEARSHCVANTLKQALQFPNLAQKLIILEDCMSNVTGFEHIADSIYTEAKNAGVQFSTSTSIKL